MSELHYHLMYPIGKFESPDYITEDHINEWKLTIDETPTVLHNLLEGLSHEAYKWHYRPHGWTISQVVHHMCDSHTNALLRFKLALTEDTPDIKPYHEGAWAELEDYDITYLHHSLLMLEAVHAKLSILLAKMNFHQFHDRSYFHPQSHKNFTLGEALGMYDWHSRHHLQHIRQAIAHQGVFPQ